MKSNFTTLLFLLFVTISSAQVEKCKKNKNLSKMLDSLKIYENIYTSKVDAFFQTDENLSDERPIFSNENSEDLGLSLVDEKSKQVIYKYKKRKEKKIKIYPCEIVINQNSISINGFMEGDWKSAGNEMFVFIGIPKDTIQNIILSPFYMEKYFTMVKR